MHMFIRWAKCSKAKKPTKTSLPGLSSFLFFFWALGNFWEVGDSLPSMFCLSSQLWPLRSHLHFQSCLILMTDLNSIRSNFKNWEQLWAQHMTYRARIMVIHLYILTPPMIPTNLMLFFPNSNERKSFLNYPLCLFWELWKNSKGTNNLRRQIWYLQLSQRSSILKQCWKLGYISNNHVCGWMSMVESLRGWGKVTFKY